MILVCGGAGYIGSHAVLELIEQGEEVVVIDNFQTGHHQAINKAAICEQGDLRHKDFLRDVFKKYNINAVIHFAADSLVGESVQHPLKYYNNNVYGTMNLLEVMAEHDVKHIVFSSTAAVYGQPDNIPIKESDFTLPTNPYGETKLAVERMLKWSEQAYGIHHVILRYFNVAGAHVSGTIGEDHRHETHLIPIVLQCALGQREQVSVYGDDYDTPDGTCIRDYIHVTDLVRAHILSLRHVMEKKESCIFNLGNEKGFSVKQIIDTARKVTGKPIPYTIDARREGDPAILVASSDSIKNKLQWKTEYGDIESIITTAWNWHKQHPEGYRSPAFSTHA
ncbi:UDP-glucose 4-epimerase GalE [Longirhabdus pacifica]|uniref:UDP-glucose 4-epimerase GalE n=1 Tax=Longirhabdus pacifica TaxID=2305227 RepID=UPI001008B728|nr:UDP-glucose 4-epimerase GalE [Longirhabdus pacifica]